MDEILRNDHPNFGSMGVGMTAGMGSAGMAGMMSMGSGGHGGHRRSYGRGMEDELLGNIFMNFFIIFLYMYFSIKLYVKPYLRIYVFRIIFQRKKYLVWIE